MGKADRGNFVPTLKSALAERDQAMTDRDAAILARDTLAETNAKLTSENESLTARLNNAIKSQNDNGVRAVEAWKVADEAKKAVDHLRAELASATRIERAALDQLAHADDEIEALTKQRAQLVDRLERASTPSKADAKADRRLASKQAEIDALTAEVHKLKAFIRSIPKDVTIRREPQAGDTAITPEAYGRLERINTFTPDDVALSVSPEDRGLAILTRGTETLGTIRIDDGSIDLRKAVDAILGDPTGTQAGAPVMPFTTEHDVERAFAAANPTPVEAPSV